MRLGRPRAMERGDRAVSEAKPPTERAKHVHRIVRADPAWVTADHAMERSDRAVSEAKPPRERAQRAEIRSVGRVRGG